jgi:hypothetical protein
VNAKAGEKIDLEVDMFLGILPHLTQQLGSIASRNFAAIL